jgi:lipopolysaccharide/colanic/teichoic acid biosynthesis glycosyltransferase
VFVERFREQVPDYMARHRVRAGMTGLAQIEGLKGDSSIRRRVARDLYYIENWSLALDLKILWRTLRMVMRLVRG